MIQADRITNMNYGNMYKGRASLEFNQASNKFVIKQQGVTIASAHSYPCALTLLDMYA